MSRQSHPYRATIDPVAPGEPRPLWSVMIPTYHCARYLAETLTSVLAQDPGPEVMQIEVVDDFSTADDPAEVVREIGRGRVGFYRQPRNVGHVQNFATCLQRARGQVIHLLHGDDLVQPGFYSTMAQAFVDPQVGAAFCRHHFAGADGHIAATSEVEQPQRGLLVNALERLALEQRIMTPSIVVRRAVYEALGGFDARLVCAEDWEMWVRIAAHYAIWYEPLPLAIYRMHTASNTGRHVRSGDDLRYTRLAIDLFAEYLPLEEARAIVRQAKETYALAGVESAFRLGQMRDWAGMIAQAREALVCARSLRVLRHLGRRTLQGTIHALLPASRKLEQQL